MPIAVIRSIEFLRPPSGIKPDSDSVDIKISLEDGSSSEFTVATPDQPGAWLKEKNEDFSFGKPVLFVKRIDQETVGEAASAMAEQMGGFWLRYYNSREQAKKPKAGKKR